jgi:hypothetical protein
MICICNTDRIGYQSMFDSRPQTFLLPPRRLRELRTAELLVVCSLRLWARSDAAVTQRQRDWREGLFRAGLSVADALCFHSLCRMITATALRSMDIRHSHCAHLGEDEGWLVGLLGLLQRDQARDAESVLSAVCPPGAVRLTMHPARAFARALNEHRLRLPLPVLRPLSHCSCIFIVTPLDPPRIH